MCPSKLCNSLSVCLSLPLPLSPSLSLGSGREGGRCNEHDIGGRAGFELKGFMQPWNQQQAARQPERAHAGRPTSRKRKHGALSFRHDGKRIGSPADKQILPHDSKIFCSLRISCQGTLLVIHFVCPTSPTLGVADQMKNVDESHPVLFLCILLLYTQGKHCSELFV